MKFLFIFIAMVLVGCTSTPVKTSESKNDVRKIASEEDYKQPRSLWCHCKSQDGKIEIIINNDYTNGTAKIANIRESGKDIYALEVEPYNDGYIDVDNAQHFNLRLNPDFLPDFNINKARAYLNPTSKKSCE